MLTKSVGATMKALKSRQNRAVVDDSIYKTEDIMYNGHKIKDAIVAYFCRMDSPPGYSSVYVFSYNKNGFGGDYYSSLDFVTEKQVWDQHQLPDELFDI